MAPQKTRVVCIGECMVELSESIGGGLARRFGGDTLNTAVYLAREGMDVAYATALGDDPWSDEMVASWRAEGIDVDLVAREPGRLPGLYLIRTDGAGERSFHYWRDSAPARDIFRIESADRLAAAIRKADWIYLSAITIGILDVESRLLMFDLMRQVRERGGKVVFDSNYRPRLWEDEDEARTAIHVAVGWATHALPTFEDEQALFGDISPATTVSRLRAAGVEEIVVKQGPNPALVAWEDGEAPVGVEALLPAIDTTAAGDSFNAAYIAARIRGDDPVAAARAGHGLASRVIMHQGAIMPRTETSA